jgi:hypothetical protein
MTDLAKWKLHGAVKALQSEIAEWDLEQQHWRPARPRTSAIFDGHGRILVGNETQVRRGCRNECGARRTREIDIGDCRRALLSHAPGKDDGVAACLPVHQGTTAR